MKYKKIICTHCVGVGKVKCLDAWIRCSLCDGKKYIKVLV